MTERIDAIRARKSLKSCSVGVATTFVQTRHDKTEKAKVSIGYIGYKCVPA